MNSVFTRHHVSAVQQRTQHAAPPVPPRGPRYQAEEAACMVSSIAGI